jgi:hypothetical protein
MAITTLTELKSAITNWSNRTDLSDRLEEFIALAEAHIQRDRRIVRQESRTFTAVEDFALPEDFGALIDLYHDGATQYGRIKIVSPMELSERKARHGDSGVPRWAAVVRNSGNLTLRFAPEPPTTGSSYSLRMVYESLIPALDSSTQTTNWLLTAAPDIYLYASLAEVAGYLLEDQQEAQWLARYERAAEAFHKDTQRQAYSGPLTPRPSHIIGEGV